MKTLLATASTAILVAIAGHASAQTMPNGEVALTYYNAPDDSYNNQVQATGSFSMPVGMFGVQGDVSYYRYGGSYHGGTIGLHGYYEVSPGLNIGLAYTHDADEYGTYNTAYLEAAYRNGPNRIEAFYGQYTDDSSDKLMGIEYGYTLDTISSLARMELYAGYARENYSYGDTTNGYIGAKFDIGNGFKVDTRYASMQSGDYRYISIGLTKTFGTGATFGQRGFEAIFPGY